MKLAEWRAKRDHGEEFETPSGLIVSLRRVSLFDLAERGAIPAPLAGLVQGTLDGKGARLDLAQFPEYAELINLVVAATVVDPPIALEGDDEHLAVAELPMADRLAIFNWANGVAVALQPFRREAS